MAGGFLAYTDYQATTWTATSGQITSVSLKDGTDFNQDPYVPDIQYSYTVNGNRYSGNCCQDYLHPYFIIQKQMVQDIMAKPADVRFDPLNPSESRLAQDIDPWHRTNVVFLFSGILIIFLEVASKRKWIKPITQESLPGWMKNILNRL